MSYARGWSGGCSGWNLHPSLHSSELLLPFLHFVFIEQQQWNRGARHWECRGHWETLRRLKSGGGYISSEQRSSLVYSAASICHKDSALCSTNLSSNLKPLAYNGCQLKKGPLTVYTCRKEKTSFQTIKLPWDQLRCTTLALSLLSVQGHPVIQRPSWSQPWKKSEVPILAETNQNSQKSKKPHCWSTLGRQDGVVKATMPQTRPEAILPVTLIKFTWNWHAHSLIKIN